MAQLSVPANQSETELAIVTEFWNARKQYDTPLLILPNDQGAGTDTTNSGSLNFSQKRTIRVIEFYSNSRYLVTQRDELGREKPFYNIINAICDTEDAAKDFSTKDIEVTADDEHYVESFLLSKEVYEWGKATRIGTAIKESKRLHTRYGSVLAKKVIKEVNGQKTVTVEFPEWKNVICDQRRILERPIIEIHWDMSRSELFEKRDVWDEDAIKAALAAMPTKGKISHSLNVYELRGLFPQSFYEQVATNGKVKVDWNDTNYTYQYHVLAQVSSKRMVPLYWEDNTEKVYKYIARKPKAGRAFGVGVPEENEQAQVWINDTVQKQQRAFEYSSRVVMQSASKKLKGRNVLTEVEDGQILETDEPISSIALVPPGGLQQFDDMIEQWWTQAQRISSAYNAQTGAPGPSGTAFRTQALQIQQSSGVFAELQAELGMFWEDIFNEWILPYIGKQINAAHILQHDFTPDELKQIDQNFATYTANQRYIQKVLSGGTTTQVEYDLWMQDAIAQQGKTKSTRFLSIPKGYFKDTEAKVTVNITGENKNKAVILESLFNIMTVYAQNPALATNPVLTKLFLEIVEQSGAGISPVSIMAAIGEQAEQAKQQAAQQQQVQPVVPQPGNGQPVNPLANVPQPLSLSAAGGRQ